MKQTRFFANPTRRSPISRLPTELLDAIFIFHASECAEDNPHVLGDPLEASRTVSHVSSRWRDVALNNSRLWNQITLIHWWKKQGRLEWIKSMIKRTRSVPLTLRIWIGHGWDEEWDQNMALILTSLLPRVEVFDLRLDSSYCPTEKFRKALTSASAPLLESLKMAPYNFLSREPIDASIVEPTFPPVMPKLTRVQYELDWNYVPYFSLSNVTHFKLTCSPRHGSTLFTPLRCVRLLNSMPLLEELSLSIDFTDLEPSPEPELVLELPHLKYFYLDAVSSDCGLLLSWFTFNPGSVLDVRCTDSETDGDHALVREAVSYYATDTELDMTDKILMINILHDTISLVVYPTSPSSDTADNKHLFRFTTVLRGDDESDGGEGQEEPMRYIMFAFLVRTAHLMKLTKCSELHLNVDFSFFIEDCMAPIFGPLVRACKNIKTLALKGTKNGFMRPLILNNIDGTGGAFDEKIFSDIDKHETEGTANDREFLAEWEFSELMKLIAQASVSNSSTITSNTVRGALRGKMTLQTVRILHTEFDVTTIEGKLRLAEFLAWRDRQTGVVDSLLWPVRPIPMQSETDFHIHEITMADMMHNYLKPPRVLT